MNTARIILCMVLALLFLTMVVALFWTFKKKSRTTFSIPDCQCIPPAPHFIPDLEPVRFNPISIDFFEVTLKSGKKEMVARKNVFTIRTSNEGGTIIMSPGGVAFTCTDSYEKIKKDLL